MLVAGGAISHCCGELGMTNRGSEPVVGAEAWSRAGDKTSVELLGFGMEVVRAVGVEGGGVVAGVASGEGDGEGSGDVSCSSIAIVA